MRRRLAGLLAGVLAAAACATTSLESAWRDPRFAGPPVDHVLVCARGESEGAVRGYEDRFVAALQREGVRAQPCYEVLAGLQPTEANIDRAVARTGVDAVVMTHPVGISQTVDWEPAFYPSLTWFYGPMWGPAWGYGFGWGPGYYDVDTRVVLETSVYTTNQNGGRLVWSGRSSSWEPSDPDLLIDESVPVFVKELERAGIVPMRHEGARRATSAPGPA